MQSRSLRRNAILFATAIIAILICAAAALAQSTGFTYQGRLTDGGTAANGNFDLQFALWDSLSGGAQVGSTQTLNTVAVSNGVFTVSLDFGANAFPGASRFLEISARPSGASSFTLLTPRQPITSTPYAVRSLNAATADSVPASGVPAGSGNYIQNSGSPQTSSNFNISGNGTAGGTLTGNLVNATTQYNLNGSRVLSSPAANLFAGLGAGSSNTTGDANAFFGSNAGERNTSGSTNSFFGFDSGATNINGTSNAFFGTAAGAANTSGSNNVFVGAGAGQFNTFTGNNTFVGFSAGQKTLGISNAIFGAFAGVAESSGQFNSFFGTSAGSNNTAGSNNAFFGVFAGQTNRSGNRNTIIGSLANVGAADLTNATAIGACAVVSQSNSLILGSTSSAQHVCSPAPDTNVGIGTTAPARLFHLKGPGSDFAGNGDLLVTGTGTIGAAITFESTVNGGGKYSWISTANSADSGGGKLAAFDVKASAYRMVIDSDGNVGIGTTSPTATLSVNGGANKPGGGSWGVFSDERLKNIKGRFTPGLRAVMQLQPLRYEYKPENALNLKSEGEHVGFNAQAVQQIIPEAVSTNNTGYLLVNNDPILWTMLNAIKEQQAQIKTQQQTIAALTRLVCQGNPRAQVCKKKGGAR